jgi:hypothetical protein
MKTITLISIMAALFIGGTLQAQTTTFRGTLQVRSTWSNTKVDGSTIRESFSDILSYENLGVDSTNAVNKGDMTKIIVKKGTLTNDVSVTYNLASVANSFGDTVAFTKVKFVALLIGGATETNSVYQLGGAATNAFAPMFGSATDYLKVPATGFQMLIAPTYDGYAVGTSTNLMVKNISTGLSTNTTYTLWVGGI